MMGRQGSPQPTLFYHRFNLEDRVRKDHILRKIDASVDFDFIYGEVEALYGVNGNESVPPPVILRLMVLLVLYNVRSERELMATVPERLDWLWFLGFDLDSAIPNHSVLSKARARWGDEPFRIFFERTIASCVEAGLVNGRKMFCDSSLVQADASKQSLVDRHSLKRHLNKAYRQLEKRLEEESSDNGDDNDGGDGDNKPTRLNQRFISTTDPDATLTRKSKEPAKLSHQAHRGIDTAFGVITATIVGPGDEHEAHRLSELMDQHADNTGHVATTVVADTKYGTNENLIDCHDRGVRLHARTLKDVRKERTKKDGIFDEEMFRYDEQTDTYTCPAGQPLRRRNCRKKRQAFEYAAKKKVCLACELRSQCTRNKTTGRSIKRHFRADAIEQMRQITRTSECRADLKRRQHFMERSFAQATRFGFKRARYRGRQRVAVQDYLIAAVQNMETMIRHGVGRPAAALEAILTQIDSLVIHCLLFVRHSTNFAN